MNTSGAGNRGPRFWVLFAVAAFVGLASLVTECTKASAYGTCIASDTSTVATNVTKNDCLQPCPTCSWEQNR